MSNTEEQTASSTAPTHIVYQVRENQQKGYWKRIGAAWAHKDSKGFSVQLDSVPLDGKIIVRAASENK